MSVTVPLAVFLGINLFFLFRIWLVIHRQQQHKSNLGHVSKQFERAKSQLRALFSLVAILGLAWIFGIAVVAKPISAFKWIFTVAVSTQGLVLLYLQYKDIQQVRRQKRLDTRNKEAVAGVWAKNEATTKSASLSRRASRILQQLSPSLRAGSKLSNNSGSTVASDGSTISNDLRRYRQLLQKRISPAGDGDQPKQPSPKSSGDSGSLEFKESVVTTTTFASSSFEAGQELGNAMSIDICSENLSENGSVPSPSSLEEPETGEHQEQQ